MTARFIEIRARITAGGITVGSEARRLAIRATRFVPMMRLPRSWPTG